MPLAYPSTLDRLPAEAQDRAAVVLRGGALEPDALHGSENSQAKAHANAERGFQADAQRVFLSQAGPRFSSGSSSSWASPFLSLADLAPATTKATLPDRLRESSYAAGFLADTPPIEGDHVAEREAVDDGPHAASLTRGGLGRFGRGDMRVPGVTHGSTPKLRRLRDALQDLIRDSLEIGLQNCRM